MFPKLTKTATTTTTCLHQGSLSSIAHFRQLRLFNGIWSVRFLTTVFLILIQNNVSAIGGYASQQQQQHQKQIEVNNFNFDKTATPSVDVNHHQLAKRMDLESCIGQFDVHKNTIIRTGESQAIGGRFLQGLELDTTDECQRLCCETESCDVYVFEEKNDGYCYLFECGPPENFHCKFTRHANYTSALLSLVRHVAEATTPHPIVPHISTSNITQQEWELTNLKVKPDVRGVGADKANGEVQFSVNSNSVGSVVGGIANTILGGGQFHNVAQTDASLVKKTANLSKTAIQCGRFQFPCHSGECIAVYNACDGIPQCEDGSDEGPECSGATSSNSAGSAAVNVAASRPNADVMNVNTLDPVLQKSATGIMPFQSPPFLQQQSSQQTQQNQIFPQIQQPGTPSILTTPLLVNNREDAAAWANRKLVAEAEETNQVRSETGDLKNRAYNHKMGLQFPNSMIGYSNVNPNVGTMYSGNMGTFQHNSAAAATVNAVDNGAANRGGGGGGSVYMSQSPDITGMGVVYQSLGQAQQQQQQQSQQQQQQQPQQQTQQQQQQLNLPAQNHIFLPQNFNWPQQQSQQQQQQQQQSVSSNLPTANENGVSSGSNFILNAPPQTVQQMLQPQPIDQGSASQSSSQLQSIVTGEATITLKQPAKTLQPLPQQTGPALPPTTIKENAGEASAGGVQHIGVAETETETEAKAGAAVADDEYEEDYEEEKSTEPPPKKKQRKHKKLKSKKKAKTPQDPNVFALEQQKQQQKNADASVAASSVHEQYKIIHENLALEFRDHDGQSERPGGAVLSLTLGVIVTAALAILIGCRMRTVSRRARRLGGKTPYTHEADFLVNGMYL